MFFVHIQCSMDFHHLSSSTSLNEVTLHKILDKYKFLNNYMLLWFISQLQWFLQSAESACSIYLCVYCAATNWNVLPRVSTFWQLELMVYIYWIPNIIIITKSNAPFLVNSSVLAETVLARVEFKEERLDITASDLATLRKGAWVNDQVKHTARWPWNEQLEFLSNLHMQVVNVYLTLLNTQAGKVIESAWWSLQLTHVYS